MKIGVISDTHGYLDPRMLELFAGVDHILHAGDVGSMRVISELERVAPVTAILGNVDEGLPLPESAVVELGGRKFLLRHIINPHTPDKPSQLLIQRAAPDVVVFGHTHKPFFGKIGRLTFFNPGYAGPQRFRLPRTVALLHCDPQSLRHEYRGL